MIRMLLWQMLRCSQPIRGQCWVWVTNQRPGNWWPWGIVPFIRHDSQRQYLSSPATMGRTHLLQRQTIVGHNMGTIWTLKAGQARHLSWQILAFLIHSQIAIYAAISPFEVRPGILQLIQLLVMVPSPDPELRPESALCTNMEVFFNMVTFLSLKVISLCGVC